VNVLNPLVAIAQEFSPRYERGGDDLVSIDVSGLEHLVGSPRTIGEELRREAAAHGAVVHVALARTRSAALVLALARSGLTVVEAGREAGALASLPIGILEKIPDRPRTQSWQRDGDPKHSSIAAVSVLKCWGVRTLGEFATLPPADLMSRLGPSASVWQATARGEDVTPLVPTLPQERFESSFDLEWPVEGLESLSFVLTRLIEPLSTRLERRDRGAAVLHLELRLVTKEAFARHLQLPSPIRDVRTLRTLLLLDLESHPPPAAIDGVTVVIDPTPGRIVQHGLFLRAHPTPEQLSALLARLGALMGQDRIGSPITVDSYRPGAFTMEPFATDHDHHHRRDPKNCREAFDYSASSAFDPDEPSASGLQPLASALRRCRQPVPARVAVDCGRPVRVTTDRRGFAGGVVTHCAGPWRSSGNWWAGGAGVGVGSHASNKAGSHAFNRDEWDVTIAADAVYRIFRDRDTDAWFIDAIVD